MKIEIKESCQGYIWMSDRQTPDLIENKPFVLDLDENQNPFILEGHLYVKGEQSISIKYIDGKYMVKEYDLMNLPKEWIKGECKEYIPHRLKREQNMINKICFEQYWLKYKDKFCLKMETLIPAAFIFTGFK